VEIAASTAGGNGAGAARGGYNERMARAPTRPAPLETVPVVFQAGAHTLRLTMDVDWRWSVAVDGTLMSNRYMTQVEAWEEGVREAARLDQASAG
jgi:hypothetical protein